jgi:hypothetical protein
MPRAVMEKVDDVKDQIANINREMGNLRMNQKKMLEIKKKNNNPPSQK